MQQKNLIWAWFFYMMVFTVSCATTAWTSETRVSGTVKNGYRILDVTPSKTIQSFTVYRGDYIKFKLPESIKDPVISFPGLDQEKPLTHDIKTTPYFKMKQTEEVAFTINTIQGKILVIEYQQARYRTMTASQASQFIKDDNPFILDVRTPREYAAARIENSILIPVQVLNRRKGELKEYKDKPVLIYCATGNRSTVASKILIDDGFLNIINLRYGIVDWYKRKNKVVH